METSIAGLAAGVAQVKRELDILDDQIRADLVACADLQTQLNQGAETMQRLAEEIGQAVTATATVQVEDADLQLLSSSLAKQEVANNKHQLQLEVRSSGAHGIRQLLHAACCTRQIATSLTRDDSR
jgi:hypothetical protein